MSALMRWQIGLQLPKSSISVLLSTTIALTLFCLAVSLYHTVLLKPLPYPDAERLVKVEYQMHDEQGRMNAAAFNYQSLMHLYQQPHDFEEIALVHYAQELLLSHAEAPLLETGYVTPEWFSMLNLRAELGTTFNAPADLDRPVAVLSHQAWQRYFNSDPNVLSQVLQLGKQSFTVIGVAQAGFQNPVLTHTLQQTDVWLAWDFNLNIPEARESWWSRYPRDLMLAKLKPAQNRAQVERDLSQSMNALWQQNIDTQGYFKGWQIKIALQPLRELATGNGLGTLLSGVLLAACALLLMVVINIANLQLAWIASAQRAMAIHSVLGATRKHLLWQQWQPLLQLFLLAAAMAVLFTLLLLKVTKPWLTNLHPALDAVSLNSSGIVVVMGSSLVLSLLLAYVSLRTLRSSDLNQYLQQSGKGAVFVVPVWLRHTMIVSQLTLSSCLVFFMSDVAIQHAQHLRHNLSLPLANKYALELYFSAPVADNSAAMSEVITQLQALPGVTQISQARSPFDENLITWDLQNVVTLERVNPYGKTVDEHYFALMASQLVAGRNFTTEELLAKSNVMIVNETFAKSLGGAEQALGTQLSFNLSAGAEAAGQIVGVVADIPLPHETQTWPKLYNGRKSAKRLLIAVDETHSLSRSLLNQALADLPYGVKVHTFDTLNEQRWQALFATLLTTVMAMGLAAFVVLIAIIGIVGVVSYSQVLQLPSIALKVALGATRGTIWQEYGGQFLILLAVAGGSAALICAVAIDYLTWSWSSMWAKLLCTILVMSLLALVCMVLPLYKRLRQPLFNALHGAE
ncbi:ABC transporter permease [Pseudoalteromonas fenneropenaei]|uniref:ABC transporter permease n=1 Tax=Pseudoalteromonas fenneropenaei TaxID=1737459 RepID=A0ABV7CLA5_9GAMM